MWILKQGIAGAPLTGGIYGTTNIPHVTVADDLAVLARMYSDMQAILWDVGDNTNRERYCVNPSKCSCVCYNVTV